jgi:hypothetical protein
MINILINDYQHKVNVKTRTVGLKIVKWFPCFVEIKMANTFTFDFM